MIEFSNGAFNPKHVAFIGLDKSTWGGTWTVHMMFTGGRGREEESFDNEQEARTRFNSLKQQIEGAGV